MGTVVNAFIMKPLETQLDCVLEGEQSYILELVGLGDTCVPLSSRGHENSAERINGSENCSATLSYLVIVWVRVSFCVSVIISFHGQQYSEGIPGLISRVSPEPPIKQSQSDEGSESKVIISDVLTGKGVAVEMGHKVSVWYSSKIEGTNVVFDQADATNSEPVRSCSSTAALHVTQNS